MAGKKLKAGILGYGGMGHCHASAYANQKDCELVAVADTAPSQLNSDKAELNLGGFELGSGVKLRKYNSFDELVKKEELDFIDICIPTDFHAKFAIKALKLGIPTFSEKPMARTLKQADAMIAAANATGTPLMIGQCLRFWPAYEYLKDAYDSGKFGKLLRLSMQRISALPRGYQMWFREGDRSGGALLDMHIHDTDFVLHMLGMPEAVMTFGCTHHTGAIDDAITNYIYPAGPAVSAETSWSHGPFSMSFIAVFEKATLEAKGAMQELSIYRLDQKTETVKLGEEGGHAREIAYFAKCLKTKKPFSRCEPFSTRETIRLALAEERSARTGKKVRL